MFFPPATHGLVSVESGDLMASEIVPANVGRVETWPEEKCLPGRMISFWNLEDEAACKTGWSGLVPKRDATVMRCKHTDFVANGLPLGIDGMIQMSTLVLLLRPALARLFQLRLMFQWRILSQDSRCKETKESGWMLTTFWLISLGQAWCPGQWPSIISGLVHRRRCYGNLFCPWSFCATAPAWATCLGIRNFYLSRSAMMLSGGAGSGTMLPL